MRHIVHRHSFATLIIFSLLLGGCGAHRLSQAQDAFSKGAQLENTLTMRRASGELSYDTALDRYRAADAILSTDIKDRATELTNDRLMAHAYTLHAMTLWRLADLATVTPVKDTMRAAGDKLPASNDPGDAYYARADAARKSAQRLTDQLDPRDKFLMEILPDLRDHDIGMRHYANREGKDSHRFFESAFTRIEAALKNSNLPANHDVRIYARFAQLQTLVAWDKSLQLLTQGDQLATHACKNKYIVPNVNIVFAALKSFDELPDFEGMKHPSVLNGSYAVSRRDLLGVANPATNATPASTCPV